MILEKEMRVRLLNAKQRICEKFDYSNWMDIGLITGQDDAINGHPRLLRSLGFGDPDYPRAVVAVLEHLVQVDQEALGLIERYLDDTFSSSDILEGVPTRRVLCSPEVFKIPDVAPDSSLIAVMMPFDTEFDFVYQAIILAAKSAGMKCSRVDDIWDDSTIIQDIFSLIYRARIVICDFSCKNPNVFYEAGIAHTLGKQVIPLARSVDDIPFDLRHHRHLLYLPNQQGLAEMQSGLIRRIRTLLSN